MTAYRAAETAAIAAVSATVVVLARDLVLSVTSPAQALVAALLIVTGYLSADFTAGTIHWLGDRVGSEHTPVLGQAFIAPFRKHHVEPEDILRHDFIELNGNSSIVLLFPLLAVAYFGPRYLSGWAAVLVYGQSCSFEFFMLATNQFHQWAHAEKPPAVVRWAQRWRLILPPHVHRRHHTAPFDTYYCITAGWLNPILERTRLYERIEGLAKMIATRTARRTA